MLGDIKVDTTDPMKAIVEAEYDNCVALALAAGKSAEEIQKESEEIVEIKQSEDKQAEEEEHLADEEYRKQNTAQMMAGTFAAVMTAVVLFNY